VPDFIVKRFVNYFVFAAGKARFEVPGGKFAVLCAVNEGFYVPLLLF
jgi:hypothetical protein